MKIYIDLKNQTILTQKNIYGKPFYIGSEYTDTIEVYFNEQPKNWNPTITYKLANGRTVGPVYPDGGPTPLADEDGSWYYYEFVVSTENGVLAVAGQLTITINVNYTNDVGLTIKRATIGNVINQVVMTANYGNEKNIVIYGDDDINQLLFDYKNEMEKLGNKATEVTNKYNTFDLGEITEEPYNIVNSTLNAIRTAGVYKFKYENQGYLMLVEGNENSLVQTVIYTTGLDSIFEFKRSYVNNVWSIVQKRRFANANDVELLAKIINRDFQKKLIDAFDADTILESINQNGKASVEQALRTINYWATQIGAFIEEVFTGKIVNKAIADQKGNVIDAVYQPKLISGYSVGSILGDINEIDGKASIEKSLKQINVILGNFNQYISNIVNGTTVVDKAKNDRNGNVIDLTYATKNALNALENKISQLIAGAPDAFDTLKEIAEYISQDQSGASAMTASINKNAQNIEVLRLNSATKQELLETEKLIDVKIEDAIISKLRSDY